MTDDHKGFTQSQRALITLRQRILNGSLPGGVRLFEVPLAEELGVSRTPVRAALSQLAEEALIDRASGGGFVVRSFAIADVVDTITLRGVLEGTAARFAAERGAPEELLIKTRRVVAEIDTLLAKQFIEIEEYSVLNAEFHRLLSQMSQSAVLQREIARITTLPFASPSAFLEDETHIGALQKTLYAAHEQHRAILEAIEAREGFRAESIAREHARAARRNVEFLLSKGATSRDGVTSLAILSA